MFRYAKNSIHKQNNYCDLGEHSLSGTFVERDFWGDELNLVDKINYGKNILSGLPVSTKAQSNEDQK